MSRLRTGKSLCVLLCIASMNALTACGGGSSAGGSAPLPPAATATPGTEGATGGATGLVPTGGPIKHIVIVIQENRTPDNLFNGFPGADTVPTAKLHNGTTVALKPISLATHTDPCHMHDCFVTDYDNGKLDGFDVARPKDGMGPISVVPRSESQPYWTIAQRYAFADRMFSSNSGPSFPAHLYLVGGQSAGIDSLPWYNGADLAPGALWSCGAAPGTLVSTLLPNGQPGPNVFPCVDFPTLADDLSQHGHSWRYYAPAIHKDIGYVWSAYSAVKHIYDNPAAWANVVSPETTVLTDAAKGNLADVTWVTPSLVNSDHGSPNSSDAGGPSWVASVVNAIGKSPEWNSTAIVITWDEWGGYYDHVLPPRVDSMGLGFRVPLIVVSPYAKHGYVSHVTHEFGSILRFAEETFGIPTLGTRDARSDDLGDMFDFKQRPAPFQTVGTRLHAQDFLRQAPSSEPPDSD